MKPITRSREDAIPPQFIPDRLRPIAIGSKYRASVGTAYCFIGCETCDPRRGTRCWRRRAEMGMVYRVREQIHSDYALGRAYLVSLVRPDEWQVRVFANNSRTPREKWHTLTGLVWEAELGEEVVGE